MIVPIVNWLCPVPIVRLHVVTLLPFVMAYVLVMMILGKRHGAEKARRHSGNGENPVELYHAVSLQIHSMRCGLRRWVCLQVPPASTQSVNSLIKRRLEWW